MPLLEEFEHWGNWLFRWRSYVPLVQFAVVLVAFLDFSYPLGSHAVDQAWDSFCLAVAFFGLAVRIYTVGHVPERTSGRNTKRQVADTLNTTGAYSLMRHPLYFGNFWIWFGISLFPRVWWCPVITTLATILFYERIVFAEEQFLRDRFGDRYVTWACRTPAIVPRFRNWRAPAQPFSGRMALRREYSGLFAIVLVFTGMEVLGTLVVERQIHVEPFWSALFLAGLVSYVVLRTLKKRRLLDIQPRKTEGWRRP